MPTGTSTPRHWKSGNMNDDVSKLMRHRSVLMRFLKWGHMLGGQEEDEMGGQWLRGCSGTSVVIKSYRKCIVHVYSQ